MIFKTLKYFCNSCITIFSVIYAFVENIKKAIQRPVKCHIFLF